MMVIYLVKYHFGFYVSPGVTLTKDLRESDVPIVKNIRETAVKNTPLHRMGEVLEVARGVVFLASSDASFITGANLVIDGGLIYNYQGVYNEQSFF